MWGVGARLSLLACCCGLALAAAPPRAGAVATASAAQPAKRTPTPDPAEVDRAIRRGIQWLYDAQNADLLWEEVPFNQRERMADRPDQIQPAGARGGQWGGLTALATYALLASGEDPENEKLARAINGLASAEITGTYALGVRAQVWLLLPRKREYQQAMRRDWQLLGQAIQGNNLNERAAGWSDANYGLFTYLPRESNGVDLSVSQYGVLGLWAANQYGAEVPPAYWEAMENAWLRWQQGDGGWAYFGNPRFDAEHKKPTSLSITAAGVASLYITQDYLHANEGIDCRGNITNPAIERGLSFLQDGLPFLMRTRPVDTNDELLMAKANVWAFHYYTLYGIERIGVASGLKFLGDVDWYAQGANHLLGEQKDDGSWGNVSNTAFALLFLSRGREPVFMNKLGYAVGDAGNREPGPWNQRPRDVANLARYVREVDERDINWQAINFGALKDADVPQVARELHDAPVSYLSGSWPLSFTDSEKAALKQYVLEGGLLLGNADCGQKSFADSFVALGEELFADAGSDGYKFRVLPDDHPIYSDGKFDLSQVRRKPRLLGLSNGVRELMVLIVDEDLARDWQLYNRSREGSFQLGTNVFLYAVDKQPQPFKGNTHLVDADPDAKTDRTLKLARLGYAGNSDPEPAGWTRLANVLRNEHGLELDVQTVDLADAAALDGYRVAHLTGTGEDAPTPEQFAKLKAFVEGGGTLLIDAAGGDAAFAQAVEARLRSTFGDAAKGLDEVLPIGHPIYRSLGEPIERVGYRLFARRTVGGANTPRLRAIELDGRPAVIVSNEDLSNGLVGAPVGGVVGYDPADATRLASAVLLYAAQERAE